MSNRNGKCSICANIIEVKLKIDGNEQLISLNWRYIREILAIEKHSDYYRVALEEYTT